MQLLSKRKMVAICFYMLPFEEKKKKKKKEAKSKQQKKSLMPLPFLTVLLQTYKGPV